MAVKQETIKTILIVDDIPANVALLEAILSEEYVTRAATRGSEALAIARATLPDLILLDIMMPDMNGYDVCRALKADATTRNIPVIFVTAIHNPGDETRGFEAGCVDYITKPFVVAVVRVRVKAHLALNEAREGLEAWNSNLKKRLRRDIATIRERTEALQNIEKLNAEIQDAREYAENIVETVCQPLAVLDCKMKVLTANHSFYDTFKVTPEETIGNFIHDLGNRQWDIPKLQVLFNDILPHDTMFKGYEVVHDFQDIGRRTFLLNGRQIFWKNIGSRIILLAMEDITERKALEEERARLAMIVESSNDAIFSVSTNDVITSWNKGAENIFGYSAGEIIGSPIFTLIPSELYHERAETLQAIMNGEQIEHFDTIRIKKDGSRINVSITTSPLLTTDGILSGNAVIARDVSERIKMEETIKYQAQHDTLTDLPNRLLFMELLNLELAQARRYGKKLALLFLDLNDFKQVNDTLGHSCGDHLLQEVARRLRAGIRESDTVARLGGDEFTVLMPDITRKNDVNIVLKKVLQIFETPFILDSCAVNSSASIGVSIFPNNGDCCEELMKKADIAMYAAKESGSNSYQFYKR
jgi:diguanylate cyclase (GGDEF)-like protein/PAS domain S-box-containing protein